MFEVSKMNSKSVHQMQIASERTYNIVKSNILVRKSRFDLSLVEQKIILRLIQIIKPDDKKFEPYSFNLKEFCEICGISDRSGQTYNYIRDVIKELRLKTLILRNGDIETICGWINEATYNYTTKEIKITLSEHLKPYLLELKNNFTEYSLLNVLSMRSKYSIRMYELLKSYEYMRRIEIKLDNLKVSLYATNYERWADFKRYVLDKAIDEINLYTDIKVSYILRKEGNKFSSILFEIVSKNTIEIVDTVYNSKFHQISAQKVLEESKNE